MKLKRKVGSWVEEDGEQEVKLESPPWTAFKGEMEKLKGKETTQRWQPMADRTPGAWERSHCSKLLSEKRTHTCATAASPPIFSLVLKQKSSNPGYEKNKNKNRESE